jgi:glc operon protein GlcG
MADDTCDCLSLDDAAVAVVYPAAIAPLPKLVIHRGDFCHELRKQRGIIGGTSPCGEHSMNIANSKRLTHAGAKTMMTAAITAAQQAGVAVTIAVTDAGGHLIVLERMEGGRFHTVHSSTTKAVCAASNKRPTSAKGAVGQDLDTSHALGLALAAGAERWTAMEGGCPVIVDGECIGGVGVAGADWQTDERIAQTAVQAIGASWK